MWDTPLQPNSKENESVACMLVVVPTAHEEHRLISLFWLSVAAEGIMEEVVDALAECRSD
jgi:hypothetical protein